MCPQRPGCQSENTSSSPATEDKVHDCKWSLKQVRTHMQSLLCAQHPGVDLTDPLQSETRGAETVWIKLDTHTGPDVVSIATPTSPPWSVHTVSCTYGRG